MTSAKINFFLNRAEDSHQAAKVLFDKGLTRFSSMWSYYTIYYLAQTMLVSKELTFSRNSSVIAAYGKEFSKTKLLDPKFHRRLIIADQRRETGHYGEESGVTDEEARESFDWAEEFMQAVKEYFGA